MKEKLNVNKVCIIALIVVIIAQIAVTAYYFSTERQGLHSDEIWCYGLANSYDGPYVFLKDGIRSPTLIKDYNLELSDTRNICEWVPGEVFNDYLTVQRGERFAYDKVFHNQSLDHHPPLYYMLLHTVCSFFPDKFSLYFAFVLNCVFLVFTQIFLFKLAKLMMKSDIAALAVCALYAGCRGALFTFSFLRQYCFLTMLLVMYSYFTAKFFYSEEKVLKKQLPPILISAFCIFMTNYCAIMFVGVMTACICVYYFFSHKKKKLMLIFGGSTLLTLLLSFAVFPAALKQIFAYSPYQGKIFDFIAQFRLLMHYILKPTLGINVSIYKSNIVSVIIASIVLIAAFSAPILFLFRDKEFVKKLLALLKSLPKKTIGFLKNANYFWLFLIISCLANILVLNRLTDVFYMGDFIVRYVFYLMPFVFIIPFMAFKLILEAVTKNLSFIKKLAVPAITAVYVVFVVHSQLYCEDMIDANGLGTIAQQRQFLKGTTTLVVMTQDYIATSWLLTNLSMILNEADEVYVTFPKTFETDLDEILEDGKNIDRILVCYDSYEMNDKQLEYLTDKFDLPIEALKAGDYDYLNNKFIGKEYKPTFDKETVDIDNVIAESIDKPSTEMLTESINDLFTTVPEYVFYTNGRRFYMLDVE